MDAFPVDYHLHTKWCEHAVGEMDEYVRRALELGLHEVGFAAHMPVMFQPHGKLALSAGEVETYVSEVEKLRAAYAGRISIRLGGEFDYREESLEEIAQLAAAHDYDYLIGSVHSIGEWLFDWEEHAAQGWREKSVEEAYGEYFTLLAGAAKSGLFDVLAHFDLIKKFGQRPGEASTALAEGALAATAAAGTVVELNSAGWHYACEELYPAPGLLREMHTRGIPVTYGSDAHRPEHVARDAARALGVARQAGYREFICFEKRKRTVVEF